MKRSLVLMLVVSLLFSCGQSEEGVGIVVKLDYDLPENGSVALLELTETGLTPVDTFELIGDREFYLSVDVTKESFYRLVLMPG